MLPTLPALSAHQANQRQASPSQVEQPENQAPVTGNATTARTMPSGTTTSHELLDLSGQMRLAQGNSVFAETLGGLLKLPRRDGEALTDYTKRLAGALAALSNAERTRLQAQLNQIMQGVSLRLLTELLRDPAGPAAARLAVQIEIARQPVQDLAERHVVNSYQQNNGGDARPSAANGNTAATPDDGTGLPLQQRQTAASAGTPTDNVGPETTGAAEAQAQPEPDDTPAARDIDDDASDRSADMPPSPDGEEIATQQSKSGGRSQLAESAGEPEARAQSAGPKDAGTPEKTAPETPDEPVQGNDTPDGQPGENRETDTARQAEAPSASTRRTIVTRNSMPEPTIYDAAALAREAQADKGAGEEAVGRGNQRAAVRTLPNAFVAEWVSELLSGDQETRGADASGGTRPGSTADRDDAGQEIMERMPGAMKSSAVTGRILAMQATLSDQERMPPGPPASDAALASQASRLLEAELPPQIMLAAPLLNRQAINQPLVPYPPVEEHEDDDDHEIKRKSPIDGDEDQRQQGQGREGFSRQGESGNRPARDDITPDPIPESAPDMAEPDASLHQAVQFQAAPEDVSPEDLPQQTRLALSHAASMPMLVELSPGAEDFYRRLAGWE